MNIKSLVFATNNAHKASEIRHELGESLEIITLKDAGILIDIAEPHDTLEANASEKSGVIYSLTGQDCFSEDTGLEVDALGGRPGVKTARFVEINEQYEHNYDKILYLLGNLTHRNAQFRTIISLRINGKEYLFEGICKGKIAHKPLGTNGFGYDPIFIPDGSDHTFAEMSMEEKSTFSHRTRAVEKLAGFLKMI